MQLYDAAAIRYLVGATLAPDGTRGAYELLVGADGSDSRQLYIFTDRGEATQLVGMFANPRHAVWSRDSEHLVCVVDNEDGRVGLVIVDSAGTQEWSLNTDFVQIESVDWDPTGSRLVIAARTAPAVDRSRPYRVSRHTFRFDGYGWVDDKIQDIYIVSTVTGHIQQITDERAINSDPAWCPDGSAILWRQSFHPDLVWAGKPVIRVYECESSTCTRILDGWGGAFSASWGLDSNEILFVGIQANEAIADVTWQTWDLWRVARAGGNAPRKCTGSLPSGVGSSLEFDNPSFSFLSRPQVFPLTGSRALVSGQVGGRVAVYEVATSGSGMPYRETISGEDATYFICGASVSGEKVLFARSSIVDPPDLYLRTGAADARVTDLNSAVLADLERPQVRRLDVTTSDGVSLDTWALTPSGPGPWPTVLCIHGGPCDSFGHVFMADHHLLVGRGMAVVFSNFRGSGGYGNDFFRSIGTDWGRSIESDHLAAVDQAIAANVADPRRLGVYGLSHGGFATTWLTTRTNRFRAGVAENPITNFHTEFGTMDNNWWLPRVMGGTPQDLPGEYVRRSPVTYAENCEAAILFIVGEADCRCPPSESEQLFRALKELGKTTEMLRLPGASHIGSWTGTRLVREAQDDALVTWFSLHL